MYKRNLLAVGFAAVAGAFAWVAFPQNPPVRYVDQVVATVNGSLSRPTGLAVAPYGGLIIADTGNHVIKMLSSGSVSILAGTSGQSGYVDGYGSSVRFHNPTGVIYVSDPSAFVVYVNDSFNYAIRRIEFAYGTTRVDTLAGNGTKGFVDGTGSTAEFATLGGVSAQGPYNPSATSNFYVGDAENNTIRQLNSFTVATFAGTGTQGFQNGPRTNALFNCPSKLAWDTTGNIYVADMMNNVIRKIDASGNVTTFAGTGQKGFADGPGSSAQFYMPSGIAFYNGLLYVVDMMNYSIRTVDLNGNVQTYAGTNTPGFVNGSLSQARFACPTDVVITSDGIMYISDTGNSAIRVITMSNGTVATAVS